MILAYCCARPLYAPLQCGIRFLHPPTFAASNSRAADKARTEIIIATTRDPHLPGYRSRTCPFLESPAGGAQRKRPAWTPHPTPLRCRQRASMVERLASLYPARDLARQCCRHPAVEPFARLQEADQMGQT